MELVLSTPPDNLFAFDKALISIYIIFFRCVWDSFIKEALLHIGRIVSSVYKQEKKS